MADVPFPQSVYGGEILSLDQIRGIEIRYGPDHARFCARCRQLFFSPQLQSAECHGCWYTGELDKVSVVYSDVLAALCQAEIPAEVTQTGGMSMAITFPHQLGRFLLTDAEDSLSWERDKAQGWALGFYDEEMQSLWEDEPYGLVPEGAEWLGGVMVHEVKSADSAVQLAIAGLRAARFSP